MMRILLTEEVLLDVLLQREPAWRNSAHLWKLCETGQLHGYVSALSMHSIFVLLRSRFPPARAEAVFSDLRLIFHTADLTGIDLAEAAAVHGMEPRASIEAATAARICADCIVSGSIREYADSSVPCLSPAQVLAVLSHPDQEQDESQPAAFSQFTCR